MILFDQIIFGPIHSRRLGLSLGVNLLPVDAKICSFNCIYCECGFNTTMREFPMPTRQQVRETLEAKLTEMNEHIFASTGKRFTPSDKPKRRL
jgi:wyosine [tRNA(Phe)-imidazoG37] synthetase (radical SAM superfamily)